jgi:thiamine biosynthesis lipoprotein
LVLGTVCRIKLYGEGNQALYRRLFDRLRELDGLLSAHAADSELSRINGAAGNAPVSVSRELMAVLERALYFAEASGGAFDPTVGPLVKLWDRGPGGSEAFSPEPEEGQSIPSPEEIAAALALVDWRELFLDRGGGTAFLSRPGMSLDLGAIAKGYAADELVRILEETGTAAAIIDLGGNIYAHGENPAGRPEAPGGRKLWRIGIQNPLDKRGAYAGVAELKDLSAVTSGVYERFFIYRGKRYHHILDTSTGYPVENGLLSVTIFHRSSMDADALSTAVFALGYEGGKALAEKEGAVPLFIFEDKTVSGGGTAFKLTDDSFRKITGRSPPAPSQK